ncbi:MAG: GNAT family N-acetyltransferase [Actinomycetaceae bacterium]|nr:GNAT family N-acetyltransferase [Actinomycetaceae bacterium]
MDTQDTQLVRAHDQLLFTIKRRMKRTGGLLIEGDGFVVYDMGISEADTHMRGACLDADGNVSALLDTMERTFDSDPRDEWTIRVHPCALNNTRSQIESAGYRCRDEKGAPIMVVTQPIERHTVFQTELVPLDTQGEQLLKEASPVLEDAFELSKKTSCHLLLGGGWTTDPYCRAAVIRQDRPVCFGMLTMAPNAKTAGIYYIATLSSCRGQGLAKDLVTDLTNEAFRLGAREVILQASELGKFVYDRLGYQEIGRYYSFRR